MKCHICDRNCATARALGLHVSKAHSWTPHAYYVKFIAKPSEESCRCGKPLKFRGMGEGFREFCSRACANSFAFGGKTRKGPRQRPMKKNTGAFCECCSSFFDRTNGRQKVCRVCVPDAEAGGIYNRYRISKSQYDTLVEKQNGRCALCEADFSVIDHNHATGKVRGLLCASCNVLIAAFDRDESWISKAKEYCKL